MLAFELHELAINALAKDFPGVMMLGESLFKTFDSLFWFLLEDRDLLDFRMQM